MRSISRFATLLPIFFRTERHKSFARVFSVRAKIDPTALAASLSFSEPFSAMKRNDGCTFSRSQTTSISGLDLATSRRKRV